MVSVMRCDAIDAMEAHWKRWLAKPDRTKWAEGRERREANRLGQRRKMSGKVCGDADRRKDWC